MKKTIALVTSNKSAYSETFIQAHKRNFDSNIKYYYNGSPPTSLEGVGTLQPSFLTAFQFFVFKYLLKKDTLLKEIILTKSFKANKIKKVYVEYGTMAVSVLKICKKLNIPMIVNFHGYDASRYEILNRYKEEYKKVFNYAESIIAVSKYMKKTLIKLGADENKITYTPCAPSNNFFDITAKYDKKYFVATGRFVDKKAPYYTIFSFKQVCEKYPEAKLYFAGNGELYNTCKNIIKYYKLEKNIILLGVIKPSELVKLYQNAMGFIQHSITAEDGDMEGTPVAILEASAAGLPIIATYHAGIPDVVIHEKTGLLVKEHDIDGMAKNIEKILSDRNYAKSLGENGKKYVKDNFSMETHIGVLNKLVSN